MKHFLVPMNCVNPGGRARDNDKISIDELIQIQIRIFFKINLQKNAIPLNTQKIGFEIFLKKREKVGIHCCRAGITDSRAYVIIPSIPIDPRSTK